MGKLIVIKIGTSSLMENENGIQRVRLGCVGKLVQLVSTLKQKMGHRVILVSSGAIGFGCIKLGLKKRPQSVGAQQAAAAAGQSRLMRMYEDLFAMCQEEVGQLLINRDDVHEKTRFGHVKTTISELLEMNVTPIINENDSVSVERLRFGDNDCLASIVAVQMDADWLFMLTDVDCLYTTNPHMDQDAQPIREVHCIADLEVNAGIRASDWGTGGMSTKLAAAKTALCAGIQCCLINGQFPERIEGYLKDGVPREGTYFHPPEVTQTMRDQRRWIITLPIRGEIVVDDGAANAVLEGKSLLAAGVRYVQGFFLAGEVVVILRESDKRETARGLVNFSAEEVKTIRGLNSSSYAEALGAGDQEDVAQEVCYRKNIICS